MEIATCARARPGDQHCGDVFLVASLPPGGKPRALLRADEGAGGAVALLEVDESAPLLLAVVDGVGHGRPARQAAELVLEAVLGNGWRDLPTLAGACHRRLKTTRGATAAFALLQPGRRLAALGVGDVRIEVSGPPARALAVNGGTVGHNLPRQPIVEERELPAGAGLFLCSDGIGPRFGLGALPPALAVDPRAAVEWIVATHAIPSDDAVAIYARYR
jgi:hypothetical protein